MILTYTSITGGIDKPRKDKTLCLSSYSRFGDDRMNARFSKCLPHIVLPAKVKWSVWVDGNIYLRVPPEMLVAMVGDFDVGVFLHPWNSTVGEEADEVIRLRLDDESRVRAGGPWDCKEQLAMTGVVVRRHSEKVARANENWWAKLCCYSLRDQLSFPGSFAPLNISYFPKQSNIRDNKYFRRFRHV